MSEAMEKYQLPFTGEQVEGLLNKVGEHEKSLADLKKDLENKAGSQEIPKNTSQLNNDSGFITSGDIPKSLPASDVHEWAKEAEKPTYTPQEVGADASGTAAGKVNEHNTSDSAHNDIRLMVEGLTTRLNALANSDDVTLDQMAEVVTYIKANRTLIESITTGKVSVTDIVNNLTTNVADKPLSAAQGVELKKLIDVIVVPTLLSQLGEDATHRLVTDTEKQRWNNKSDFDGDYNSLINQPTIPYKTSQLTNDSNFATDAEPSGAVNEHNTAEDSHNDIRLLIQGLTTRLNTALNSTDTDLDQMAELVAYIKSNKSLIDGITTNKVNVADIIDNLTTSVSNKPLSAKQGVELKALIDALQNTVDGINVPTTLSELAGDSTHRTVTDAEKQAWNNKQPAGNYALQSDVQNLSEEKVDYTDIEEELNETSENPVKNKTLFAKFKEITTQISNLVKEIGYFFGRKVTPEHYGAVGDGITDDSSAIQQAINEAGSSKVVHLAKKNYKISTGLVFDAKYSALDGKGTITYDGTGCAVKVTNSYVNLNINRIDAPNGTAIQLNGEANEVNNCIVNIDMIRSSVKGLHLYTANKSMCYNHINIKEISATDTGVLVWVDRPNTDVNPYVNQNWYTLGRIYGCNTGIKLHSDTLSEVHNGYGTNDNVFFSGSFEGIASTGCAIHLDRTYGNKFENFRCQENYGANSIIFTGKCTNNEIQLSKIILSEVDITGLLAGSELNRLYGHLLTNPSDGYSAGAEAMVDFKAGITYMPHNNVEEWVTATSFANNVITKKNMNIITSLNFNKTAYNGATFTLDPLYSEAYSIAKGYPLTMKFGATSGRIILKDSLGGTILDNTDGYYANKSVCVRWNGFEKLDGKNVWSIIKVGEIPATEKYVQNYAQPKGSYVTEDALNAKGYLTQHQDISGKVDKTEALTLTGVDADGNTHTWTIYGK